MSETHTWLRGASASNESTDGRFIISIESGFAPCRRPHPHQDAPGGRCPGGTDHFYRYWQLGCARLNGSQCE